MARPSPSARRRRSPLPLPLPPLTAELRPPIRLGCRRRIRSTPPDFHLARRASSTATGPRPVGLVVGRPGGPVVGRLIGSVAGRLVRPRSVVVPRVERLGEPVDRCAGWSHHRWASARRAVLPQHWLQAAPGEGREARAVAAARGVVEELVSWRQAPARALVPALALALAQRTRPVVAPRGAATSASVGAAECWPGAPAAVVWWAATAASSQVGTSGRPKPATIQVPPTRRTSVARPSATAPLHPVLAPLSACYLQRPRTRGTRDRCDGRGRRSPMAHNGRCTRRCRCCGGA